MSKPVVTEYEVLSEHVRKPFRIALVADLHERRAVDILNLLRAQNPDLILVAGDTLERYSNRYQSTVKRRFNPIRWLIVNLIYYVNCFFMFLRPRRSKPDTKYAYSFLRQAADIAPVNLSLGNHEEELMY